jgi:GT2 family glycosyltransferase/glycosyltransferase involved in cell wall biosynthesis
MRVLFVVHGYPPTELGGTEIYAASLARAERRLGHEVSVLTRSNDRDAPEYTLTRDEFEGIPVARINNTFLHSASFRDTYRNEAIEAVADAVIAEFRPDVVHVHHLTCLSTGIVGRCARRRIPTVLTLQDYWLLCHRGQLLDLALDRCSGPSADRCAECAGWAASARPWVGGLGRALRTVERRLPSGLAAAQRRLIARASHAAAPAEASGETARRLEEAGAVWDAATMLLAPSRTLFERFAACGAPVSKMRRQEQGIDLHPYRGIARAPSDRLRIGFLGSLMVSKAPHLLLEAAAGLPAGRIALSIAGELSAYHGDEGYASRLRPLLERPGVRWVGRLAHESTAAFLASIDALVVPSVWIENSPFVIREARAAGAVVVASNLGGMAEAVSDGRDGLLFDPDSSADLRRVLERLLDEPGLVQHLRQGAAPVRSIEEDAAWTCSVYEESAGRMRAAQGHASSVEAPFSPRQTSPAGTKIAAVVLNYRTPDDTLLAVRSLEASRRRVAPIVVVDNAGDGSCERALAAGHARARVLRTQANLGFSGGCNVGIRAVLDEGADLVLLLNSDAVVAPDAVAVLEQALAEDPRAGIAGPLIVSRAEPSIVASAGLSFAARTGRMRQMGFGRLAQEVRREPAATVGAVSGCAMLIRRPVFEEAGLFDERYFYSFEDIELCWRAARAGWQARLVPSALVYHEGGRSIDAGSAGRLYFAARNHHLLARSVAPLSPPASWLRAASIALLNAAHAVRTPNVGLAAALRAVVRGTADHARGRYGPDDTAA